VARSNVATQNANGDVAPRHKAAENRENRLKQMLVWFILTRKVQKLRGQLNTICLQPNSAPSLVVDETAHIPASSYRARGDITWPECEKVVDHSPLTISMALVIWLSCPSARASGEISRKTSGSTPFPSRLRPVDVNQPKMGRRNQ
jgi:hypothetical protein